MKIAVSGKGGVGKTTVAAYLARLLAKDNNNVLAVDADPSPSLASALGLSEDERGIEEEKYVMFNIDEIKKIRFDRPENATDAVLIVTL